MQRFRNILVGVDLQNGDCTAASELGEPTRSVINKAIWLAGQTKASVTFFSVVNADSLALNVRDFETQELVDSLKASAKLVLEELVTEASNEGVTATSRMAIGRDWQEIIRQVIRENHDLLVIGTRNLSSVQRMVVGSTGMKLLRKCPCPVWITKAGPIPEVANVLVASDLSDVSQEALNLAVSGGQLTDVKIHLVHACEFKFSRRMVITGMTDDELTVHKEKVREEVREKLQEQLAQTDYRTLTYGVQVHVIDGLADVVILEAIQDFEIDLLVMGTVARSGIPGMMIGNTAERLLPAIPCSILAIKPQGFVSPVTLDD